MAKRAVSATKPAAKPAKKARNPQTANLLWETFNDFQISVEDVAEGMARIVAYDSDALEQVVLFLGKLAGLKGTVNITIKSPTATAKELEKLCDGAVASYPLATTKYSARFMRLVDLFLLSLNEAQSEDSLEPLLPVLEALAKVHLRSLRHVSIALASGIQQAAKQLANTATAETKSLVKQLTSILSSHVDDVSPQIRALAVAAVDFNSLTLNDEAGEVRIAALHQAKWPKLKAADKKRVKEIASKDIDVKCRVAAVQVLDDCSAFLADPVPEVSAIAAKRFLESHSIEEVTKVSVSGAAALAQCSKTSVESMADLVAQQPELFELLPGACEATADKESLTASLVELLHSLCSKFSHNDEILAKLFLLFRYIDFDAISVRNLEGDTIEFLKLACDIYFGHPNAAIQQNFASIARPLLASSLATEARAQLEDLLEKLIISEEDLAQRCAQVAGLGKFIDISAFASEKLWETQLLEAEDYAQNVAFHGDAGIVQQALNYLYACEPQPDEKLMRVLVAAKIRDLIVDFDVNKIRLANVSKPIVAAAAASGII